MTKHIFFIVAITALLALVIFYPHFPGTHDPLAARLSLFVQLLGLASVILIPLGAAWLAYELKRRSHAQSPASFKMSYYFGVIALIAGAALAGAASLIVLLGESVALAICLAVFCGWIVARLAVRLRQWTATQPDGMNPAPLYLIVIPLGVLAIQCAFMAPVTNYSRELAMQHAREIVDAIEQHHAEYGSYPLSMHGLWKDYDLHVVGVERYHYAPSTSAYSLYFRQPRFLFDDFGVEEVVMYNPRNEHMMPSHASWHLVWPPETLAQNQGWHAVEAASMPHWKRFLFD